MKKNKDSKPGGKKEDINSTTAEQGWIEENVVFSVNTVVIFLVVIFLAIFVLFYVNHFTTTNNYYEKANYVGNAESVDGGWLEVESLILIAMFFLALFGVAFGIDNSRTFRKYLDKKSADDRKERQQELKVFQESINKMSQDNLKVFREYLDKKSIDDRKERQQERTEDKADRQAELKVFQESINKMSQDNLKVFKEYLDEFSDERKEMLQEFRQGLRQDREEFFSRMDKLLKVNKRNVRGYRVKK